MDLEQVKEVLDGVEVFACILEELRANIVHPHNWRECKKDAYFRSEVTMVLSECREHLGSALRMTNITYNILPRLLSHMVNHRWKIVLAKFVEAEVPKLVIISSILYMLSTIYVSTIIA